MGERARHPLHTRLIFVSAALVGRRFIRFPPFFAAYETKLARERSYKNQKFADPEATIKKRASGRRQQRQQRRRR